MRKIQIAISSDLCIRLTWNLTSSCGQQQRLRGWSRMVVNNSKMADSRHFENRYIAISQSKIIRFWFGWTPRDQNEKVALDRLRVRQNVFLVYFISRKLFFVLKPNFDIFGRNTPEGKVKNICCSLASYLLMSSSTYLITNHATDAWLGCSHS